MVLKECFIPLSPVRFGNAFLDAVEEDVASPSSKPVVRTVTLQRKKVIYSLIIFAGWNLGLHLLVSLIIMSSQFF